MSEPLPTTPGPSRQPYFTPAGCVVIGLLVAVLLYIGATRAIRTVYEYEWIASIEPSVRWVLDEQVAAWNKGDLDGFMAGYWNDDKLFYISGGKSVQGWKALKERYDKAYQGDSKEMGKLKFDELHVEPLGRDAALVRGKWEVTTSKETVGGWFTLVLKKFPDGWKITHDHTSK